MKFYAYDPKNRGYQEAGATPDKLAEVTVGSTRKWEYLTFNSQAQSGKYVQNMYGYLDDFGQIMNTGGVMYGGAEMGLQAIRKINGAKTIGRTLGFGTQQSAKALKGTLGLVSEVGKKLGIAGYALQGAIVGYKYATGQRVSTAEKVGFVISTALVGAAWVAAGTAAAPFVAAGALIYGALQLGSYLFFSQQRLRHGTLHSYPGVKRL